MPVKISKTLINKLPEGQRNELEKYLWAKSGKSCYLCEQPLRRASEPIEADHDVPEAEGGANDRENLNLAHVDCNRAKRAAKSVDVRPYLKVTAAIRKKGGFVKYGDLLDHFGIGAAESEVRWDEDEATFEFPDGSRREVPVFVDEKSGQAIPFAFVDAPRAALFNDEECQPRTIKQPQLWAIYTDIQVNPLHEPPGCRLLVSETKGQRIVMFDGQHKTIASWMRGQERVVVKVYLNLAQDQAIRLVNSVQAKIKKLPLSPFELAAKLSDEWANKLSEYEEEVGTEKASESGFLGWLAKEEQNRGKQAFRAALVQNLLSDEDLRFVRYVKRAGSKDTAARVTENAFKSKVLERMLHLNALSEPSGEAEALRSRERQNIIRALNNFTDLAFEPGEGATELSDREEERKRRMSYQSSLGYIGTLLRELFRQVLVVDDERAFLEREPSEEEWERIVEGIELLVEHPIWTADLDATRKTRDLQQALAKNQDARKAFGAVDLKLAYLVKAEQLEPDWMD